MRIFVYKQTKITDMKAKFELKTWMSENREIVISEYNKMTSEKFFNGCTLAQFMREVFHLMLMNNVKSERVAVSKLPYLMGNVYFQNTTVHVKDSQNLDKINEQKLANYRSL
jgi:hypothetical protein